VIRERTELNELFRAATSEVAKIRKQETWSATSRHFQLRPLTACSISKAAMILVREGDDPADEDELSDEAIHGANQQMPQLLSR
jgi:hypothetical protein